MKAALEYIAKNDKQSIDELFDFLRFPSVSAQSKHKADTRACADFLVKHFNHIGMQHTTLYETKGHPIVVSEYNQDDALPTLLIYGHYDVQPAEPFELWHSPPFKPEIRDGYIFARGVADDKGQVFAHIKAVEACLKEQGALPVNVIFVIEGEEEVGSENLTEFLQAHKHSIKADVALISDSAMYAKDQPSLCFSLRGMLYVELFLTGPSHDLHSGQYGGVLRNPIQALANIIAQLKDEQDKVLIPGFYDAVESITDQHKAYLDKVPNTDDALKKELNVDSLFGESGFTVNERKWLRPTLDCNGIVGGYIEEGAKTIIPSKASAKLSMRLVANQDPDDILNKFKAYIYSLQPEGISLDIKAHTHAYPAKMDVNSKAMKAAEKAFEAVYQVPPFYVGEGVTIPVVADFKRILNLDTVMMGFNLPDDGIHSPNERFALRNFKKGIEASLHFLHYLGASGC